MCFKYWSLFNEDLYLFTKCLCLLDLSQDEDSMSCYSKVAKFLLECWTRIPTKICQALLQQVSQTVLSDSSKQ